MQESRLGNLYGEDRGTGFAGNVWDKNCISPAITTMQGGGRQPHIMDVEIVAMRGRGDNNEQQLEPNGEGITNTITTVQKDNLVLEKEKAEEKKKFVWEIGGVLYQIRIRKLTPRECWRLMNFTDEDFDKAASVNSNTQLYKQAGNSIVKNVLCEVFKGLIDG